MALPIHRSAQRFTRLSFSLAVVLATAGMSASALAGSVCQTDLPTLYPNTAAGGASTSCGNGNRADGDYSQSFGFSNVAGSAWVDSNGNGNMDFGESAFYANAFGDLNFANAEGSNAFGSSNRSNGYNSTAFGAGNTTSADYSSAFGNSNSTEGATSAAFGTDNRASGEESNAFGAHNVTTGRFSSAFGYDNNALGDDASAFGYDNAASGGTSSAIGASNIANGLNSSAFGYTNTTLGDGDAAIGSNNATGVNDFLSLSGNNAALGVGNTATGGFATFIDNPRYSSAAVGAGNQATGGNSSALGVDNLASALNSTAIGYSSVASAEDSTAIGSSSVADRANTLSVGAAGAERQIVNVDEATEDTDAVNLSQLRPVAAALGGGAGYVGGVFTAPTYVIQNNNYSDVGSAFAAVDGAIDDINDRIVAVGGIQGEQGESAYEVAVSNGFAGTEGEWLTSLQGDIGPSGPAGPEGPAGGGPRSVVYDSDDKTTLTLGGANGTRISNVANGVVATDAANVGQMEVGDAETLQAANEYTDNTATETLTSANAYTDQRFAELTGLSDSFDTFRGEVDRRFQQQDRRIDKQGSMSSAMLNMAMNAAGSQSPRGRVAAGVGFQGGERALSVGYAKRIGERVSFSLGGAFSGSEKSAGMGFGVDL